MKRTKNNDATQPSNGFGRVPDELLPALSKLSHLEAHVFLMLTITTIRSPKDPNVGSLKIPTSELAQTLGLSRGSLRRALKSLEEARLIHREGGSSRSGGGIIMIHYMDHHDPGGGSSGSPKSPQPQPSIDGYAAPIRSEEVSEEEVKRKRKVARALELKAVAAERKDRAAKAAPPHPLSGLVSWDKEKREVRLEEEERSDGRWCKGKEALRNLVGITANREKLPLRLTNAEWQEGWGRLNGHLMGNPFKTNPKTLPAIVLNWFETDLRRKNNHPQRGKPLAQRIDDKARERMAPDGHTPNSEGRTDDNLKRLEIRNFRLNS